MILFTKGVMGVAVIPQRATSHPWMELLLSWEGTGWVLYLSLPLFFLLFSRVFSGGRGECGYRYAVCMYWKRLGYRKRSACLAKHHDGKNE